MCQLNLDAYQGEMNQHFKTNFQMPILFFTQMMGLAFGMMPKELGFGEELVDAAQASGQDPGGGCPKLAEARAPKRRPTRGRWPAHAAYGVRSDAMTEQTITQAGTAKNASASTSATAAATSPAWSTWRKCANGPGRSLKDRGVVVSRDYKFMCSSLGQELIEKDIKEHGSDARGGGGLFAAPARDRPSAARASAPG